MSTQTNHIPTRRVLAIRRDAVRFANDYGPLPAANDGDEEAQHEVARKLHRILENEGLRIVLKPDSE
ncbi:hypothetical protein [Phaeobacter inhibens]|uniref:hypothetical protein n=1 Tax=Phaeobacter inhibens TaxID=221822 RepID=UPI000C99D3C7|nr:hypothetical protein [Phaeobacter inhibens]AUR06891.1 hypothetical protein PhaeoP59_00690 [Phaeobacter inhibens]AUR10692.1 hypothetical protein PhaeoP48_00680 [Phaeobacter inhibens]